MEMVINVWCTSTGVHMVLDTPPKGGEFVHMIKIVGNESGYGVLVYNTMYESDEVKAHAECRNETELTQFLGKHFVTLHRNALKRFKAMRNSPDKEVIMGDGKEKSYKMTCGHYNQGIVAETGEYICILCNCTTRR